MELVPFYRPSLEQPEIDEVVRSLRSGWLTTGPRVKEFETQFARAVGAKHAVALTSCTAALHLALEALGLKRGDSVLVPTMTFAATAEVIRYFDAIPVFVDCDPVTLCPDVRSMEAACDALSSGRPWPGATGAPPPKVVMTMHYAGQVGDFVALEALAAKRGLRVIEDAAHAIPAQFRANASSAWRKVGSSADVTCFSFYANKCITTGEGGMATTNDESRADRMRLMSLHGMDRDAWKRYTADGSWYYEVVAPGFKYNMTDVAASLGLGQLARAEALWAQRRRVAEKLTDGLRGVPALELPVEAPDRGHAWHLYSVKLRLDQLRIDRNRFLAELKRRRIGHSVHWKPLHMMPYYVETYGYSPGDFPVAASLWPRLVTLPLFPGMTDAEIAQVVAAVRAVCAENGV
jgi:dTDP-4-amino-4,6-dideoxygalactose transaminase